MAGQKKTACVFHRNDRRKCMTEAGREWNHWQKGFHGGVETPERSPLGFCLAIFSPLHTVAAECLSVVSNYIQQSSLFVLSMVHRAGQDTQ